MKKLFILNKHLITLTGHSANERQVYTDLIERAEKGLIKLHCPGFPERSHFEHAYYQINPSRGVTYTLRHKAIVQVCLIVRVYK